MRADVYNQGFDEFMNLVIDDAVEIKLKSKTADESRRQLGWYFKVKSCAQTADYDTGQILLKGDNVSLIQSLQ